MKSVLMFLMLLPVMVHAQSYTGMSSEKFFDLELLDTPIDLKNPDIELLNAALFHHVNLCRRKAGRKELRFDMGLQKAADLHSSQMIERNFFDHHNRFSRKWADLDDRLKWAGFSWSAAAENIHETYLSDEPKTYRALAEEITQAFMDSAPHKANLLNPKLKMLGTAAAFSEEPVRGNFVCKATQVFGSAL